MRGGHETFTSIRSSVDNAHPKNNIIEYDLFVVNKLVPYIVTIQVIGGKFESFSVSYH